MAHHNGEFSFSTPSTRAPTIEEANGASTAPSEPIFVTPTAPPVVSQPWNSAQGGSKVKNEAPLPNASPTRVPLAPGYSQIGWMMRCQKNKRLGIGKLKFNPAMSKADVAKHRTRDDAWIIVYNLTPYLDYHPGGIDILLPVLGKDATLLFDKYHPWVNVDAMLEACWVGMIAS